MGWEWVIYALMAAMTAYSTEQTSRTNKAVAAHNADLAEVAAKDSLRRGDKEADRIRREGEALKSKQRSLMAARGLDLGDGTAQDIQDQTDYFSLVDQATAKDNAKKEAWGKRSYGAQYQAQADGINPTRDGLLAGGMVAAKWYSGYGGSSGGSSWNGGDKGFFAGAKSGDVGF
jgi:hypothetical protein